MATEDEGADIARVQVREHDIDMGLRLEEGTWRVDSVALSDEVSDAGIESPGEEHEIFMHKGATVRLPKLDVEGLVRSFPVEHSWMRVDGSGSVFCKRTFVPKVSLIAFVAHIVRDWYMVQDWELDLPRHHPLRKYLTLEVSADLSLSYSWQGLEVL